jgi:hypothetical protein
MAFAIGITIAIVAGGAAMGAGLPYLIKMWGYYATGAPGEEVWENMETGGTNELMWAELLPGYDPDFLSFDQVRNTQYVALLF